MDRRVLKTREAIMRAFIALMAEKNFEHITINEIADQANVNRGTVYLHYVDKFDLLDQCIEIHLIQLQQKCMPNEEATSFSSKELLLRTLEYLEEHAFLYATLLTNKSIPAFRNRMMELMFQQLGENIHMGDMNKDRNKEVLMQFLVSAAVGVLEWWITRSMPYPAKEMAEELWSLLERNQMVPPDMG
ncbi:transcriptional regulator, TetR family [Paenibacillus algorifonticola]|uniref:Transcriptional regulator, TetR family n=1 Tax=Paenibacillus algorifonticola TaxID=684063 RepID=A0A1I2D522_9BACL|nr:TetR/AcrR family transcriptional regulator C-terminal domain-containing protein [Paenibacillus algorifonticola]SFE75601.1 transcriptional regulator, TetR family [Paenibacillus algorifonticola]